MQTYYDSEIRIQDSPPTSWDERPVIAEQPIPLFLDESLWTEESRRRTKGQHVQAVNQIGISAEVGYIEVALSEMYEMIMIEGVAYLCILLYFQRESR
jgi:hypothetical protein